MASQNIAASAAGTATTTPAATRPAIAAEPVVSKTYVLDTLKTWAVELQVMLPAIAVGIIVTVLAYFISRFTRKEIERWGIRKSRIDLGRLLGSFAQWAIVATGVMLSLTIIIPTLKPGDLFTSLGVGAVGFGFAFQNILQNWLAGVILLLRNPFKIGDQISVNDYEGTVEDVGGRATFLLTYDGHRILIPNTIVYTQAVKVNAINSKRRTDYDFAIPASASVSEQRTRILDALKAAPDILDEPAPDVLVCDIGPDKTTLRVRWWTDPRHISVAAARSGVLEQLKILLDEQISLSKSDTKT